MEGAGEERWSSRVDFRHVVFKTQVNDTTGNLGSTCNLHFIKFGLKGRLEVAGSQGFTKMDTLTAEVLITPAFRQLSVSYHSNCIALYIAPL